MALILDGDIQEENIFVDRDSHKHKHKQETINVIRKFMSIPKDINMRKPNKKTPSKKKFKFHKHKQETNNVISKFTGLPKVSTCVSQTRRHQHKHNHKNKHKQETNNVIRKFTRPTKDINMRKPNKKTSSKKFFKFSIAVSSFILDMSFKLNDLHFSILTTNRPHLKQNFCLLNLLLPQLEMERFS
ncbi:hypothetical protein YC2023_055517 [Brassica napus]